MMSFNEETGQYEFPAEVRMQLQAAGKELGINTEKMIEMSRQTSKIKDIKMKVAGDIDPDVAEAVAGMAKFDSNQKKWQVDFGGEKIDIGDSSGLQEAIKGGLLDQTKTDSDIFKDIAKNTLTMSQSVANIGKAGTETIATESGAYEAVQEQLKGTIGKMEVEYMATAKKIAEKLDVKQLLEDSGLGEGKDALAKSIELAAITPITMLREALDNGIDITNMDQLDGVLDRLEGVLDKSLPSKGGNNNSNPTPQKGGGKIAVNNFTKQTYPEDSLVMAGGTQSGGNNSTPTNINISINGKLDLSSKETTASVDVTNLDIQEFVKMEITNSLNGANYSGGKVGSSLNTA